MEELILTQVSFYIFKPYASGRHIWKMRILFDGANTNKFDDYLYIHVNREWLQHRSNLMSVTNRGMMIKCVIHLPIIQLEDATKDVLYRWIPCFIRFNTIQHYFIERDRRAFVYNMGAAHSEFESLPQLYIKNNS